MKKNYTKDHTGHRDYFTTDVSMNEMIKSYRGFEKKTMHAWVRSDGVLLCTPSDDLDSLLAMKDEMQKKSNEDGFKAFLGSFYYDDSVTSVSPPPDPDECVRGGHAVGGPEQLQTPQDILRGLEKAAKRHYAGYEGTKFYVEGSNAFMEKDNVRAWIVCCGKCRFSSYVSMIKKWSDDYHDVCLGDYNYEYDAIEEALVAFIRYQMIEAVMEEY